MSLLKASHCEMMIFREALAQGKADLSCLKVFADGLLMTEPEPDYFLVEVSLCSSRNRAIGMLDTYIKSDDFSFEPKRLFELLSWYYESQQITTQVAIQVLYALRDRFSPREKEVIIWFENQKDLVSQFLVTMTSEDLQSKFDSFLKTFHSNSCTGSIRLVQYGENPL